MINKAFFAPRPFVQAALWVSLSVFAPAAHSTAEQAASPVDQTGPAHMQGDAEQVIALIARSDALRQKVPPFIEEATQSLTTYRGALPAAVSIRIAQEMAEANAIRNALFNHALRHRNALYRVDDGLDAGARINAILISMSAALTLFDNAHFMHQQFAKHPVLRSKLNEAYTEFGVDKHFYDDTLLRANALSYRTAMSDALRFFQDNQAQMTAHLAQADDPFLTLYRAIERSPARKRLGADHVFRQIGDQLGTLMLRSTTESVRQVGQLKFLTSRIVGNSLGLVRWRAGKLKDDQALLATLATTLQPGDILLEKTPFALTDKTIPGHFGHAAIYIGTVEQLRELGALDLPGVQRQLAQIQSGHVVLEALRGGVVLNTLESFMNIDDVAVLRAHQLTPDERKQSIALAMHHYGKRYDFNFDVNTTDTIVCSELVYAAYPQINFVTKQVLSSFTIAPDDIAKVAGGDPADRLKLAFFAHDGQVIFQSNDDQEGLKRYLQLIGSKR